MIIKTIVGITLLVNTILMTTIIGLFVGKEEARKYMQSISFKDIME